MMQACLGSKSLQAPAMAGCTSMEAGSPGVFMLAVARAPQANTAGSLSSLAESREILVQWHAFLEHFSRGSICKDMIARIWCCNAAP